MDSKKTLYKGIALMLLSAVLSCVGQLLWKLAARNDLPILVVFGFGLYGFGAILMILALRYGELSMLHPMMSFGYIMSLILGVAVLGETVSVKKVIGVGVIVMGLVFLSSSGTEVKE